MPVLLWLAVVGWILSCAVAYKTRHRSDIRWVLVALACALLCLVQGLLARDLGYCVASGALVALIGYRIYLQEKA